VGTWDMAVYAMLGMDTVAGLEETNRRQAAIVSICRAYYFGFGSTIVPDCLLGLLVLVYRSRYGTIEVALRFFDLSRRGAVVSWSVRRQNGCLLPF